MRPPKVLKSNNNSAFLAWKSGYFELLTLASLMGGALGNMHNRVFNDGKVIDFIEVNLHFPPANPWPTFNLADVLLTVGVAVLLVNLLVRKKL